MTKYLNIIFFLLYVVTHPKLWIALFSAYLPVYIQFEWLRRHKIKTVIDVGAHEGKVSQVMLSLFNEVKIYAFEPQKELAARLSKASKSGIVVINAAVGDRDGKATIHVPHFTPGASILPFSNSLANALGHTHDQKVDLIKLDTYFKEKKITGPILLKIDTQGYEMKVLKGAQKLLRQVEVIHVETPLTESYEGSSLFDEIFTFLKQKGFSYKGAIPDGQFLPVFTLPEVQNSIFIKDSSFVQ